MLGTTHGTRKMTLAAFGTRWQMMTADAMASASAGSVDMPAPMMLARAGLLWQGYWVKRRRQAPRCHLAGPIRRRWRSYDAGCLRSIQKVRATGRLGLRLSHASVGTSLGRRAARRTRCQVFVVCWVGADWSGCRCHLLRRDLASLSMVFICVVGLVRHVALRRPPASLGVAPPFLSRYGPGCGIRQKA